MVKTDPTDNGAPGWDAIDATLRQLYPGQEPRHRGNAVPGQLGGSNPLDGISAYRNPGPPSHWHYITYGLSDLYGNESARGGESGWGFELTFRLAAVSGDPQPPVWPLHVLQTLAGYVFRTGNVFDHGHHMDANGPILADSDTQIRALATVRDPQLPPIETPSGKLTFL